ncbi:hypothetical protein [Mesorhizobium sp. M0768]|uniref:hypothetical protein n=1 Tax=Mesorhizobium sp. M0768 TaxID=2956996 RepID=UPI00333B7852
MTCPTIEEAIERLLDASAAVAHAEGIYSAGARRELDRALAAVKGISSGGAGDPVDRADVLQEMVHSYSQVISAKQRRIDALVAALEPFANMPMPEQHGEARERIHKARAALALARGAEPEEPTEAMKTAALNAIPMDKYMEIGSRLSNVTLNTDECATIYQAMVTAAIAGNPSLPSGGEKSS